MLAAYNYVHTLNDFNYLLKCRQLMSLITKIYPLFYTVYYTGNPGSYLSDSGTVYITRDGGLTWEQVCT